MTTMGHAFAVGATANPAPPLTTSAVAPNAPSNVTSIATDGAAIVSWQAPVGGPAPSSNVITPYIAGVAQAPTTVGAVTSATVSGLTNATSYTFSVHALNGAVAGPESAQSGANTPRAGQIFGEEFNGSVLDPHWRVNSRDGDQSAPELQYWLPGQAALDGLGNLKITATNTSVTAPGYDDTNPPTYVGANVTRSYRSAQVQWKDFTALYGTGKTLSIQVSAQMPAIPTSAPLGSGVWPAIWSLGANCEAINPLNPDNVGTCNWPNAGSEEIDNAEFWVGGAPYSAAYNAQLHATGTTDTGSSIAASNPTTTFHEYKVDWSAGQILWKLDGVLQKTVTSAVPSTAQFLLLQVALAGTVANIAFPVFMLIDYVRVFNQ